MSANWLDMTSSTGGTGVLTLTSRTGQPSYASFLGASGTRFLPYIILEFTDATFSQLVRAESGIGNVNLGTLALTRTKRFTTWDGTSYVTKNPTALSFGTTSANIRVILGPQALFPLGAMAFLNTTSSGADPAGATTAHACANASTLALVAGTEYWVPFLFMNVGEIINVGISVTVAGTSAAMKAAIYTVDSDGLPGPQISDFGGGTLNLSTTGQKVLTTSLFLPPGWYWTAMVASVAATVRSMSVGDTILPNPAGTSGGQTVAGLTFAGSYATGLPSPGRKTGMTAVLTTMPTLSFQTRN